MKEGQTPFNRVPFHASWFDVNPLFLKFFIGFWILGPVDEYRVFA
jgi:hypothetical protein